MPPLVSVIIPAFNRSKSLLGAIDSVLNQTFFDLELLVVDDFSTDDTAEMVQTLSKAESRLRYIPNQLKGANNARNLGMELSTGKYLVFLDSDDKLCPTMVESHFGILDRSSEYCVSVSYSRVFRQSNSSEFISSSIYSPTLLIDYLVKKVTWPINTVMLKRDFLQREKIKFHPELLNGQDYCFFLSVINAQPSIAYIHKVLSINHHLMAEPKDVKVSAGDTLKHKVSRLKSRNIALSIAWRGLSVPDFFTFLRYFAKYQGGLIYDIARTGFR